MTPLQNPSLIAIARGDERMSDKAVEVTAPRAMAPLWSRQQGITVPSAKNAICSRNPKQEP